MRHAASSLAFGGIARFNLPVSGIAVTLRHPTGLDDLLLMECSGDENTAALLLAHRLARTGDGGEIAWEEHAATDLDTLLLRLRQVLVGDRIVSDLHCPGEGCGSRVNISFSIEAWLAHHQPKSPAPRIGSVLACADEPGWFHLELAGTVRFRPPTIADQIHAARQHDPEAALARTCIRPERIAAPLRRRVAAALQAIAPALAGELQGQCPDCGAMVAALIDPRRFCPRELRDRARFIYEDVDLLACRYHWAEQSILSMPNARRANYVELALASGSA